jgi:peptidyl-prolyl cis-trans isomerase C
MRITLTTIAFLCLVSVSALGQESTAPEIEPQADPMAPVAAPTPTPAPNPMVLKVNGEPVYAIEISMIMQTIQGQLTARGEEVDPRDLAQSATQRAIEQRLLAQEARRFGIEADELQVARAAQMTEEQSGGRAALEASLKASGSTYDQFLGILREIETIRIFIDKQVKPNVVVTDETIAEYYEANPTLFDADERVHAYHMIFIVGEDKEPALLETTRQRAEAARQRLLTGEEAFTAVAMELSEGPSKPRGGDLGWVTRGQLVSPLSETVFSLKPGEISEVIQTRFGFHIATISDRRPAEHIALEEASPQIREFLTQEKATESVSNLLQTLIANAKVENLIGGGSPATPVGLN